jgi:hypothetical protein
MQSTPLITAQPAQSSKTTTPKNKQKAPAKGQPQINEARVRTLLNSYGFPVPPHTSIVINRSVNSQGQIETDSNPSTQDKIILNPNQMQRASKYYNAPLDVYAAGITIHEAEHIKQYREVFNKTGDDNAYYNLYGANICKYEVPAEIKRHAFFKKAIPGFAQQFPKPADMPEYGRGGKHEQMCKAEFQKRGAW